MALQSITFKKCWELLKKKRSFLIQLLLLGLQNVPLSLPHDLAHREKNSTGNGKKWQHSGSEDYLICSLPVFVKLTELKTFKSLLQKRAGIPFFHYRTGDRVTQYTYISLWQCITHILQIVYHRLDALFNFERNWIHADLILFRSSSYMDLP